MFLFKNLGENEAQRIIQKLFLFFKKAYKVKVGKKVRGKSKRSGAQFQYLIPLHLTYNKSKLYKPLDYWSGDMVNFHFVENGSGIVFDHILCTTFQEKCFSCNIILIICFLGCDVINFEIEIKPFFYMTKK